MTASYNSGKYLKQWAKSILIQDYRPLEVVIVEDVSDFRRDKGRTSQMFKVLAPQFADAGIDFVTMSNSKRMYCASSYEKARKHATGEYFGVLDADDMLKQGAVSYVVSLYDEYPEVTYIYTQHQVCSLKMQSKKIGICCHPGKYKSLLNLGKYGGKHGYSHWRTFSNRLPRPDKIFKQGLKCAVDKYMGYRLEEQGIGMFTSRVCYKYRQRWCYSISTSEPTRKTWRKIMVEASHRRKQFDITPFPILKHKPK